LGDLLPPPYALFMTREARGEYARRAFSRFVTEIRAPSGRGAADWQSQLVHFELAPTQRIPLGWRIGDQSMCVMIGQLTEQDDKFRRLSNVVAAVAASSADALHEQLCPKTGITAKFR